MRRFSIYAVMCVALLMGLCSVASARDREAASDSTVVAVKYNTFKHGVRVGVSGTPLLLGLVTDVAGGMGFGYGADVWYHSDVSSLYRDYYGPLYTTGNVGAEFDWALKKWLTVSAGAYFTGFWASKYDGFTGNRMRDDSGVAVSLMGTVRFTYLNRKFVQMYSGLAAGAFIIGSNAGDMKGSLHFQLIPLGISVGNRVFGFAEIGVGTLYMGGNIGLGYRF